MQLTVSRVVLTTAISGLLLAGAGNGFAQTDQELELLEARTALGMALGKISELEKANAALGESLAAANAEADQYRESYQDVRLQMEALGIEAISPDRSGLERRLLKAVNDLRLLEDEKKQLAEQLVSLSEASMSFMKSAVSPSADLKELLEAEIRVADSKIRLGSNAPRPAEAPQSVERAQVVDLKPDYGLIVLGVGEASGLRIGTPIELVRGTDIVATALVVDVRQKISGAVLQSVAKAGGKVRLGDRVQVFTGDTL